MSETGSETELHAIHMSIRSCPTQGKIAQAVKKAEEAGLHFKSVADVRAAAQILALKELCEGVSGHLCEDPSVCIVMRHHEKFLAVQLGQPYSIDVPLRDEVLRDVRSWRSRTTACNPCPYSAVVIQRGLDPYMLEEDQQRACQGN